MADTYKLEYQPLADTNIQVAKKLLETIFPPVWKYAFNEYKNVLAGSPSRPFVVYLNGEAIGVTGLYELPDYPADIWLMYFGILPKVRGKGLGKQILLTTIEMAKQMNKKTFRLWTYSEWNKTAQPLYKKYMHLCEPYTNPDDNQYDIENGKPMVYSYNLENTSAPEPWANKFLNVAAEDGR